ncbi:helix-turn-helix DNA binding domain protein [Gordonia phage ObLaDi]|uniref:Helix-turn-helix DNA binding domain protein n=4 Tax=Cafassovirus TaxID=3425056 RepID=A0A9E7TRT7_9CAUD|nr:helix-turn-helix DNA binding domain protein [Gordonia phage Cafasso]UVK59827.1 helix-turn-helix DNA binding domain protein [Gordonia phage Aleemily]UXE03811.1 helix-turn-helix DNA binding domain protein [Gordonia phage ObLaDi]
MQHHSSDRIGLALRSARVGAGMTQTELAERAGIDQATLSRIERGLRDLRYIEAVRLCEAMSVDLYAPLGGAR